MFSKYYAFVVTLTKCPTKSKEGSTLTYLLRGWLITVGRAQKQGHEAVTESLAVKQERTVAVMFAFSFLFNPDHSPWGGEDIFTGGFLLQVNLSINSLMECPKLYVLGDSRSCHTDV